MLAVVSVLILGGKVQIVGIQRLDPDKCLVTSRCGGQLSESAAAPMLRGLGLALRDTRICRRIHVYLHHERELRKFFFYFNQSGQDFLPSRRPEEIVIDQEQR